MSSLSDHRNNDATLWVGNLDERVTEDLLKELFFQIGRITKISMHSDLSTRYAFIEFEYEEEVEYAMAIMKYIKLYGREMKLNYHRPKENASAQEKSIAKNVDVGANLYIGNLDENVTEEELKNSFEAFGNLIRNTPYIAVDDSGNPKGHAFISYDSFDASDLAIECMHGQYFNNRILTVQYAFKQGGNGLKKERHGTLIERRLAKSTVKVQFKLHKLFAERPGEVIRANTSSVLNLGGNVNSGVPQHNASNMPPPPPAPPHVYAQPQHNTSSMPPPPPVPTNYYAPLMMNPTPYGTAIPSGYNYNQQLHQQNYYNPPPHHIQTMPYGQAPYTNTNQGYYPQQYHQPPPFPHNQPR